ncbi:hypothetical protein HK096_001153, partial [Nowakowskiella sp. JEL0078]
PAYCACEASEWDLFKAIIYSGGDFVSPNDDGNTPLHAVANSYYTDAVAFQLLVGQGADVNAANNDGETPIFLAALMGNWRYVRILIEAGATVNCLTKQNRSLLHVVNEEPLMMSSFLSAYGTPNIPDNEGLTPLMYAAMQGYRNNVKLLLQAGADVNLKNNNGNALHLSLESKSIVDQLLKVGIDVNTSNSSGETPLILAVKGDEIFTVGIIKSLIDLGANTRVTSSDGDTLLHLAIFSKRHDIFEFLLENDFVDVNAQNNKGETPLHIAVWQMSSHIVELLLNKETDVNVVNKDGVTPLLMAVQNGCWKLVTLLVNADANLNLVDENTLTSALHDTAAA